jgi:hypothetical protein
MVKNVIIAVGSNWLSARAEYVDGWMSVDVGVGLFARLWLA